MFDPFVPEVVSAMDLVNAGAVPDVALRLSALLVWFVVLRGLEFIDPPSVL